MNKTQIRILITLLLVLAAVLSFCTLGPKYSDPDTYAALSASIDSKTDDALKLTAGSTLVSACVTMLPDDVATPVADKLADFTQYFLGAMCVLYAEKYMMPLIGIAVFRVLLPVCCCLIALRLWLPRYEGLSRISLKLLVFSGLLLVVIPVSIKASDIVYATYAGSIQDTIRSAESLTLDMSLFSSGSSASVFDLATQLLNNLLEALAVTITTSCVIPLIVLVLFVWLAKILLSSEGIRLPRHILQAAPAQKETVPAEQRE